MNHPRARFPDLPEPPPRRLPAALRDRVRLLILGGLAIMLIGDLLPWLRLWLPGRGFFEVSGFERAGDAGIILELGLVILALTWSDQAWNSRITVLVAGPLALGLTCAILLRVVYVDSMSYVRSLANAGGYGSLLPWFWITLVGALIVTAGGATEVWRARDRVSFAFGLNRVAIGGTVGGLAGGILGFVGGVNVAELFTSGSIATTSTSAIVLLSLAMAFLGAWTGAVVGAGIARSTRGR